LGLKGLVVVVVVIDKDADFPPIHSTEDPDCNGSWVSTATGGATIFILKKEKIRS
jgi:hypothetical protein